MNWLQPLLYFCCPIFNDKKLYFQHQQTKKVCRHIIIYVKGEDFQFRILLVLYKRCNFVVNGFEYLVHCITQYYAYQGIFWKPEKTSKFQPIHSTMKIWTDFHENKAKKNLFFLKKNPKWPFFKNGHFSKSPILKKFS